MPPRLALTFVIFKGGGEQGFQNAPVPDSLILDGVGAFGTVQSERGLTLYELPITGHM
jgi:carboxypeptidase D